MRRRVRSASASKVSICMVVHIYTRAFDASIVSGVVRALVGSKRPSLRLLESGMHPPSLDHPWQKGLVRALHATDGKSCTSVILAWTARANRLHGAITLKA